MPSTITCRCGQLLPLRDAPEQTLDCVRCRRAIVVVLRNQHRGLFWVAVVIALLSTISAAGLLGYAIGRPRGLQVDTAAKPETLREVKLPLPAAPEATAQPSTKTEPTPVDVPKARPEAPVPIQPAPFVPPTTPDPVPPNINRLEANRVPYGGYKVGEVVTQEVVFSRKSAYQIVGIELSQGARYSIQSSLTITKVNPDGSFVVEQAIQKTKLIEADADMKATLTEALDKSIGAKFEIAISALGEAAVTGVKDPIRVQNGQQGALGQSVRLWSLLDADAWRELAGLTFFQPAIELKNKATWTKPVTHDWGPLGGWKGKTIFLAKGQLLPKSKLDVIDYGHRIDHTPAQAGAVNQLPIELLKVKFTPVTAEGRMHFNAETQRTTSAEETFRVRGLVTAQMAGSAADVELQEYQSFHLSITEPNEAKLVGVHGKTK
jgi:hypothetical protein